MSRFALATCLFGLFLIGFPLTGQNDSSTAPPDAGPRKVRPLPAGAVPVNSPPNSTPSPSAAVQAPSQPSAGSAKSTQAAAPAALSRTKTTTSRTAPVPSPGTSSQATSPAQDRVLEAVIRAKLAKSKVGRDGFTVRVQGGVAFWEGQTGVVQHKGAATRMARTAGAKQVVNNIRISEAARQQAMANLQQRRTDQAKRSDTRSQ